MDDDEDAILATRWLRIYWNTDAIAFGVAIHPYSLTLGFYVGPFTLCLGDAQDSSK